MYISIYPHIETPEKFLHFPDLNTRNISPFDREAHNFSRHTHRQEYFKGSFDVKALPELFTEKDIQESRNIGYRHSNATNPFFIGTVNFHAFNLSYFNYALSDVEDDFDEQDAVMLYKAMSDINENTAYCYHIFNQFRTQLIMQEMEMTPNFFTKAENRDIWLIVIDSIDIEDKCINKRIDIGEVQSHILDYIYPIFKEYFHIDAAFLCGLFFADTKLHDSIVVNDTINNADVIYNIFKGKPYFTLFDKTENIFSEEHEDIIGFCSLIYDNSK